jgi:hypothetical protein
MSIFFERRPFFVRTTPFFLISTLFLPLFPLPLKGLGEVENKGVEPLTSRMQI